MYSRILTTLLLLASVGAVWAAEGDAAALIRGYETGETLSSDGLDALVRDLGHARAAQRREALARARNLNAMSLALLMEKLKAEEDPELSFVAEQLSPILEKHGKIRVESLRLIRAALDGDARAQAATGLLYREGAHGLKWNAAESLKWARAASEQKDPVGMYLLAWFLEAGRGVKMDRVRAVTLQTQARKQLEAQPKADRDAWASLALGYMRGAGVGGERDVDGAKAAYVRAGADVDNMPAALALAKLYTGGWLGEHKLVTVVNLLGRAVKDGLPAAKCELGHVYSSYRDGSQRLRFRDAAQLFEDAAQQGHPDGLHRMGIASLYGYVGGGRNAMRAVTYLERAISLGHTDAMVALADVLWYGKGLKQDRARAIKLYEQAAEREAPDGLSGVAYMYLKGRGREKDVKKAIEWYERAADKGSLRAIWVLGWMYYTGDGVNADTKKAIAWLQKGVNRDDPSAQNSLAWIYATCPDETFWDGKKAVELAKRAVAKMSIHSLVDTLAAAYARVGRFEDAVREQRRAIRLLHRMKNVKTADVKDLESRLKLYRDNKPAIQTPKPYPDPDATEPEKPAATPEPELEKQPEAPKVAPAAGGMPG